jgi:hypothetical protein
MVSQSLERRIIHPIRPYFVFVLCAITPVVLENINSQITDPVFECDTHYSKSVNVYQIRVGTHKYENTEAGSAVLKAALFRAMLTIVAETVVSVRAPTWEAGAMAQTE